MKKFGRISLVLLAAVLLGSVCASCHSSMEIKGDSHKVTQTRNVKYFSQVELYSSANVIFTQGDSTTLRIVGAKDLADNLLVEQNGEKISIKVKPGTSNLVRGIFGAGRFDELTVFVTSPDLTAVSVNGSGGFYVKGNIDTDRLTVSLKGSGDISFNNVVCDAADMEVRGSGDAVVKNITARDVNLNVYGSGDLNANIFAADNTNMAVYGSGDISVKFNGCGNATAAVKGSGDITLSGTLTTLSNQQVSGSGDIHTGSLRTGVKAK